MPDEPSSYPDLASLDLSFAPAWAKGGDAGDRVAKLAAKHARDERPERGGKRRDPRREREERGRFGGTKGRRDSRFSERRDGPPSARGPEPLTGWKIQFLPDKHGVDGLAKQIKGTAKAYPLFDLAQLVLDKSERYLVEFKRVAEDAPPLFQLKSDGSLWLSEREAVAHALDTQMDTFYRRECVSVDPPKGSYPCVAVCGMSGELLGPPNYHDYQTKVAKLHAARFSQMPLDVYKSRIQMKRDEETIAKWKEAQSVKDVFFPIETQPVATAAPEPADESPAGESTAVEPAPEASVPEPDASEEVTAAETPAPEEIPSGVRLETLAEVEAHFRAHHLAKAVVQIRQRVLAPGSPVMNSSSPAVHTLARREWNQLRRFPLPLAHVLGQQLASRGVQLFKAHENVTYAGLARPHYLDLSQTPLADGLREILTYVEAHPRVPRAEQWKALVALRPVPAEGGEEARENAVAADLSWLLHQGHIIDFVRRGLEAARKPKAPPKPAAPPPAAAQPSATDAAEPADETKSPDPGIVSPGAPEAPQS